MLKRILILTMAFCLAAAASAQAKTLGSEAECRILADQAVIMMTQGKFSEAIKLVSPFTTISKDQMTKMGQQFAAQRENLLPVYGKRVAVEFIKEEKVGGGMLRYLYLEKFENNALVIWFTFYRPEARWKIISFGWHDKPQNLFE